MFWIFSFSNKSIYRSLALISACALSAITYGCTAQQIEYQALAHNQAFSASADKILLTNIIRASRIMPVDYTSVTEYKAKEVASGSIVGKIPFGADALRIFSSDPSVNVGPGIASLDIKDFAQQKESFARLYEDVEIQSFINLHDWGWDWPLIMTMLVQKVRIRGEFANQLILRSDNVCKTAKNNVQCKIIEESMNCGNTREVYNNFLKSLKQNNESMWGGYLLNSGDNKCDFLDFQTILARFYILHILIDTTSTKKIIPYFFEQKTDVTGKKYPKSMKQIYDETNEKLSGKNGNAFEVVVRSTHLMLRYLGQLARAQMIATGDQHWIPAIYLQDGNKKTPLFIINNGYERPSDAAIAVEIEGQSYSIPTASYGNPDMSLYLFAYLRIRLDQAYAQAKLPPSNTLILR